VSALEVRDLEVVYRDRGRGAVRAVAGASVPVREAGAGIVVEDVSVASLRGAVTQVLSDAERGRGMSERGRAAAARFRLDRVAEQVVAAYERVCASRRQGGES